MPSPQVIGLSGRGITLSFRTLSFANIQTHELGTRFDWKNLTPWPLMVPSSSSAKGSENRRAPCCRASTSRYTPGAMIQVPALAPPWNMISCIPLWNLTPLHRPAVVSATATDQLPTLALDNPCTDAVRDKSSNPVMPRLKAVPAIVVFSMLLAFTTLSRFALVTEPFQVTAIDGVAGVTAVTVPMALVTSAPARISATRSDTLNLSAIKAALVIVV